MTLLGLALLLGSAESSGEPRFSAQQPPEAQEEHDSSEHPAAPMLNATNDACPANTKRRVDHVMEILKMQHTPAPKKVDHVMEILKMQHTSVSNKIDHVMEILKMQHTPKVDHVMEILKMQHIPAPRRVDLVMEILKMQHTPAPKKVDHMMEILKMQLEESPELARPMNSWNTSDHMIELLKMAHIAPPAENVDHAQQTQHEMCNKSDREMAVENSSPPSAHTGTEQPSAKSDLFFEMLERTFRFFTKEPAEMSSEDLAVARKLKAGYAKRQQHAKDILHMHATFPLSSA
jgi:hypothetical protein